MNRSEAIRFLLASQDNAKLAAWISILCEYRLGSDADIAPSDHWEAFETLFNQGLVSEAEYNRTDIRKDFLLGRRPNSFEIQKALDNWKILKAQDLPGEKTMTKVNDHALTRRQAPLAPAPHTDLSMAPPETGGNLSFPAPAPQLAHPEPTMDAPMFPEPFPAPAFEPEPVRQSLRGQQHQFEPLIICGFCKTTFRGEVSEGDESDEQRLRDAVLVFYMYHGKCPTCGHESHHSTEGPAPYGMF